MPDEIIIIEVDNDCTIQEPKPKYKRHHKKDCDTIQWRSDDTDEFWIHFDDTPFENGDTFHATQHRRSKPPAIVNEKLNFPGHYKEFKYTITAQLPNHRGTCKLDPKIIIDDGSKDMDFLPSRVLPALAIGAGLALAGWALTKLLERRENA
ncbi:MAG: hypothetical protein ACR2NN_08905 [Bryobacteraceae bacterium]